ncbi:MAG: hypothetical protein IPJ13_27730 [Saprospiraceae bacterium]|nr:hypothetical protein [Saprospiraceae bacterium]
MKHILIIFTALLFTLSCSKSESENSIPDCLDKKISTFKDNLICDRAQVKQYLFQSKTVFVFDNQQCCCDHFSEVMDANCKLMGNLGGIASLTKINGDDFSKATFVNVVWKSKL